MKLPININFGIYSESEESRTDMGMVTYYEHNSLPTWFVEGAAQLVVKEMMQPHHAEAFLV